MRDPSVSQASTEGHAPAASVQAAYRAGLVLTLLATVLICGEARGVEWQLIDTECDAPQRPAAVCEVSCRRTGIKFGTRQADSTSSHGKAACETGNSGKDERDTEAGPPSAEEEEPSFETQAGEAPPAGTEPDYGELAGSFGAAAGAPSAAPNIIGDFFGGGARQITIRHSVPLSFFARGFLAGNSPGGFGSPDAVLVFETGAGSPNDFATNGPGTDASGDGYADTFPVSEPLPPSDAPVAPGPGFTLDGGTAVFTNSTTVTTAQDGVFADGDIWFASYSFSETLVVEVPGGGGAGVRRVKLAENNSPVPRDRVFGVYNFFDDVPFGFGDVHRFVPGFEKTFDGGQMSIDVRFPFASTLASDQFAGMAGASSLEFGNLTATWKAIVRQFECTLLSAGLGLAFPTADDTRVFLGDGTQLLQIDNEAVHLLPFVAMLWTPTERTFCQAFVQFDVDLNGNPTYGGTSGDLPRLGSLRDPALMFLDVSAGYRCWENPCAALLTAITPVAELHYSTTLQDETTLVGDGIAVLAPTRRFDVLDLTLGAHLTLGDRLMITPAVALPLRTRDDAQFDFETLLLANWYF